MVKLNWKYFYILALTLCFFNCKKAPKCVISFGVHYEKDYGQILVNDNIFWEDTLTTNYSIGRAIMNIKVFANKKDVITVKVNSKSNIISQSKRFEYFLINFFDDDFEIKRGHALYPIM